MPDDVGKAFFFENDIIAIFHSVISQVSHEWFYGSLCITYIVSYIILYTVEVILSDKTDLYVSDMHYSGKCGDIHPAWPSRTADKS